MRIIPVLECYYALGCVVPSLHTWAVTIPFIPWLMGKPDEKQMVCDNDCFFFFLFPLTVAGRQPTEGVCVKSRHHGGCRRIDRDTHNFCTKATFPGFMYM